MEYTIQTGNLCLTADTEGAELHGLSANGLPLLWEGRPEVWGRHAPVCFPWCGMMDGWFEDEGREYREANERHGFVRAMEHTLIHQERDALTFRLDWPGNDTLWPWAFRFETVHQLEENRFVTTCTAENRSQRDMPIQFGFHPALRCPFLPDTRLEDYQVRFANGTLITLHRALFDMDSICFPQMGDWARLEHGPSGQYLQIDTAGYDYVLLWSTPGIPGFVCIEPWQGYPGPGHELMARPSTRLLAPGQSRSWKQVITVQLDQ